jgi:hypothetical protein
MERLPREDMAPQRLVDMARLPLVDLARLPLVDMVPQQLVDMAPRWLVDMVLRQWVRMERLPPVVLVRPLRAALVLRPPRLVDSVHRPRADSAQQTPACLVAARQAPTEPVAVAARALRLSSRPDFRTLWWSAVRPKQSTCEC